MFFGVIHPLYITSWGKLLVGLLTDVFRRAANPPAHIRRLPSRTITAASDLLSQKTDILHNHSYRIARDRRFRFGSSAKHVQDFHLIPLFRNKDACPSPYRVGSRICHKAGYHIQFSIVLFIRLYQN